MKCVLTYFPNFTLLVAGKTVAFMLPILERLLYRPVQQACTRVLILVPTRELAVQVHQVGRQLGQFSNVDICLAAGQYRLQNTH